MTNEQNRMIPFSCDKKILNKEIFYRMITYLSSHKDIFHKTF